MNIVLVGAGGSGLSALVELMVSLKIPNIVCIDSNETPNMEKFRASGITTYIGHGQYQVTPEDLVIYSAAAPHSVEVKTAVDNMLKDNTSPAPMLYFEFLGELSKYMYTIAISGTHGKSTTTGMVGTTCIKNIPSTGLVILGAGVTERKGANCWYNKSYTQELYDIVMRIVSRKATGIHIPKNKLLFVVEADEFNHHFLFLEPDISVITSLDHDHIDIYPTRESYLQAFRQFCENTRHQVITLPEIMSQLGEHGKHIYTPQTETFSFDYLVGGHNHRNATLAFHASLFAKEFFNSQASDDEIKKSIEQFQGLQRRVELLGKNKHGVAVFSDYGHHPDEIESTLHAFHEKYPDAAITCFFEAHQARRLLTFWQQFVEAFANVACIVVPPYTAREDIASFQLWRKENTTSSSAPEHIDSFSSLAEIFSDQIGGSTITKRDELPIALDTITGGAILCFSAGILDSKVRDCVAK